MEIVADCGLDADVEYRQSNFDDLEPRRSEDRVGITLGTRHVL